MRIFFTLLAPLFLYGCSISSDVMVEVDNQAEPLRGSATATLLTGTFYAEDSKGLYCNGAYNSRDCNPSLQVNFQCSDGRSGSATISRYGDYFQHGTGEGTLSDGTTLRAYLGNEAHKDKQP